MEAFFKDHKRAGTPTFKTLGERMEQGGKQKHDRPGKRKGNLAALMGQGEIYSNQHIPQSLGALMGQGGK